jgi:L-threonylcarbamoyladenylate synthase
LNEKSRQQEKLIWILDPVNPGFDIIEKAADIILDGGVIAFPTDTVYGLACDSTNKKAVERIYQIKGRSDNKPLPLLIDGMKSFSMLIRNIPPGVINMLEDLWPGALTVILPKSSGMLSAVSSGESIGIRVPDCIVTLSVISMVARPLAVTSANPSDLPPATSAEKVEEYFGRNIDMILDGGESTGDAVSTVLSLLEEPYKILRQGTLSCEILSKYFDNIE